MKSRQAIASPVVPSVSIPTSGDTHAITDTPDLSEWFPDSR